MQLQCGLKRRGQSHNNSKKFRNFAAVIIKYEADMNTTDIFKRYDSPEQYAEAFQQMIDARERWREQSREQSAATAK